VDPNGPILQKPHAAHTTWDYLCHCSKTSLETQIVSPSFVRQMRDPNLIALWKNALDFLRRSEHWVMIGYGFPDEDIAVRALFTRAFSSRRELPLHISVFQRGPTALINYESFFQKGSLNYLDGELELLLDHWKARKT
jgi:hypothetical protein